MYRTRRRGKRDFADLRVRRPTGTCRLLRRRAWLPKHSIQPFGILPVLLDEPSRCIVQDPEYPRSFDRKSTKRIETECEWFKSEFDGSTPSEGINQHYADRIATLASRCCARSTWHLSYLTFEWRYAGFSVLPDLAGDDDKTPVAVLAEYLNPLSNETLEFLFFALLAGELLGTLVEKFQRMGISSFLEQEPSTGRFVSVDNPDYPTYQAYEIMARASTQKSDEDEQDPLYGSAILLNFIRDSIRDALLVTPLNYQVLYLTIQEAAKRVPRFFPSTHGK